MESNVLNLRCLSARLPLRTSVRTPVQLATAWGARLLLLAGCCYVALTYSEDTLVNSPHPDAALTAAPVASGSFHMAPAATSAMTLGKSPSTHSFSAASVDELLQRASEKPDAMALASFIVNPELSSDEAVTLIEACDCTWASLQGRFSYQDYTGMAVFNHSPEQDQPLREALLEFEKLNLLRTRHLQQMLSQRREKPDNGTAGFRLAMPLNLDCDVNQQALDDIDPTQLHYRYRQIHIIASYAAIAHWQSQNPSSVLINQPQELDERLIKNVARSRPAGQCTPQTAFFGTNQAAPTGIVQMAPAVPFSATAMPTAPALAGVMANAPQTNTTMTIDSSGTLSSSALNGRAKPGGTDNLLGYAVADVRRVLRDSSISLNAQDHFEQIPKAVTQFHALLAVYSDAKRNGSLDNQDLALIERALRSERADAQGHMASTQMCQLLQQQQDEGSVDIYQLSLLDQQAREDALEQQAKQYSDIIELLSPAAKSQVAQQLEQSRGNPNIRYQYLDFAAASLEIPQVVTRMKLQACQAKLR